MQQHQQELGEKVLGCAYTGRTPNGPLGPATLELLEAVRMAAKGEWRATSAPVLSLPLHFFGRRPLGLARRLLGWGCMLLRDPLIDIQAAAAPANADAKGRNLTASDQLEQGAIMAIQVRSGIAQRHDFARIQPAAFEA